MTLNQRKILLENTITEMMKDSDRFKFELLSKSHAPRRAANEKQADLNQCLKQKKKLLEEMKTHQ